MIHRKTGFSLLIMGLLLTGCEGFSNLSGDNEAPIGSASPSAAPTNPVEETSVAAPSPADATSDVAALPPVNDDPDQFLGATGVEVAAALGEPSLVRKEGPAEIWQYQGPNCILDLFLYAPESGDGPFRVDYIELRNPALTDKRRRACLADMLRARLVPTS